MGKDGARPSRFAAKDSFRAKCWNLPRLQSSPGTEFTVLCVSASSPTDWGLRDLLKVTPPTTDRTRAGSQSPSLPGQALFYLIFWFLNKRYRCDSITHWIAEAIMTFYTILDFQAVILGEMLGMWKRTEIIPGGKEQTQPGGCLGLVYFILIGMRLWVFFFNLRSCFFFLCVRVYYFREEVGVQLCCGGLARLNALVWPVWNLLHITFEYMLPHCSFVSSVKTLSGNCVYKSICTRLCKIRRKYFFSFHYSLEFKRKPQIIWPSFRPLA